MRRDLPLVIAVLTVTACGSPSAPPIIENQAPELATFTASPSSVVAGVATQVTWDWSYANAPLPEPTCFIEPDVGAVVRGGTTPLTLTSTTEFTLSCDNSEGMSSLSLSIEVTPAAVAPVITTFNATPESVVAGVPTEVTWTWAFANAPSPTPTCTLDNGVGAVSSGSITTVTLAAPTSFTLTCTNSAGSVSATKVIATTTVAVAPELAAFDADPFLIPAGIATDVTWTWTLANSPTPAPTCEINRGVGMVSSGTSTPVTIAADTLFTLTCTNEAGSDSAQVTVAAAIAPQLATFTATPSAVDQNVPTSTTWNWTWVNSPTPAPTCTIDNGVGPIAEGGSTSITLAADTVFTLTCANAGGSHTATTTVTVTPPSPPMPCPPTVNADSAPDSMGNCPSFLGSNVVSLCTCGGVSGAPADQTELSCNPGAHTDRMYCWRAPTAGTFRFALSPGSDLALGIFSADTTCGELACNASTADSQVDVPMQAGQQVYIAIEETSSSRSFTLAINPL